MRLIDRVAKVTQLDQGVAPRLCAVQQGILQLDVSVRNAHLVAVVQRKYDLLIEEAAVLLFQAMTKDRHRDAISMWLH